MKATKELNGWPKDLLEVFNDPLLDCREIDCISTGDWDISLTHWTYNDEYSIFATNHHEQGKSYTVIDTKSKRLACKIFDSYKLFNH